MKLFNNFKKEYWRFLEFLLYPLAITFVVFFIVQYILQKSIAGYDPIIQAVLIYFAALNLIKIAYHQASIKYMKTISLDLIVVFISIIFIKHTIIFQSYIILRQFVLVIDKIVSSQPAISFFYRFRNHPSKVILLSFAFIIILGTSFLSLPIASATGKSIGFINAFFTSTSATCVTGLIVVNTGTAFSLFGKIVIFCLMQIGGLGIMTFSTALILLFGKRMSIGGQSLMKDVLGNQTKKGLAKLTKAIVLTTFSFELIGAIIIFLRTYPLFDKISTAISHSIFHSVSAFCNAGFCLYSNSFSKFQGSFIINITMMSLIICGGIGFSVLMDLKNNLKNKKPLRLLSLHSKVVIITSFFLIILGAILIFIFEYKNQFQNLPLKNGFLASIFQSVTTRTAGFNTMDISKISHSTSLWMIVLMFIGASPGSTGGGIKTTAFAIMLLSIWSIIKGRDDVEVFHRSVYPKVTKKVTALIAISIGILIILVSVLLISESKARFIEIIFESFSAFGTVGLSMGLTPYLTGIGKIAIILLMYLGRVGPLTIAFALGEKKYKARYHYPEEDIAIG